MPDPAGRIAFGRVTGAGFFGEQLMALYAIDPDGTDLVQLNDGKSYFPASSPDGMQLAFTLYQADGSAQVAVMDADGAHVRMLTSDKGIHEAPSWSPDGTWIAYDSSALLPGDPSFHTVLYRMDPDGSRQAPLGDPAAFDFEPKISPDGKAVLFQRFIGASGTAQESEPLLVRDLATGSERVLTVGGAINPSWAPDGTWIVAQTEAQTPGWTWGPLVRIATAGISTAWITLYPATATSGGFKPVFSPDGTRIAFGCATGQGTPSYNEATCLMNADGTHVTVLVDDPKLSENEISWGVAR